MSLRTVPATLPDVDEPDGLAWLQRQRAYPSVSILMATARNERDLAAPDRSRLDALIADAERRLADDVGPELTLLVVDRLRDLATDVAARPPAGALALFASPQVATAATLHVPVRDRVVVDETFATRDLVAHVHRSVRFSVVGLSERTAYLYAGSVDHLRAVDRDPFPLHRDDGEPDAAWLRRAVGAVDGLAVAGTVERRGVPLVLAGSERVVAEVRRRTRAPVLGVVRGSVERSSWADVHQRVWPTVESWLDEREREALARLDAARGARRYAAGIDETWSLALDGRVDLLVVEQSFEYAVRVVRGQLEPAADVEAPDVVDDVVDELIEAVAVRGGDVVLVPDGRLVAAGRVAAALRY